MSTYYGGADACQGDSGGPLKVEEPKWTRILVMILIYLLLMAISHKQVGMDIPKGWQWHAPQGYVEQAEKGAHDSGEFI